MTEVTAYLLLADDFQLFPARTLKPLLAIAFATTTPLGIGIGLAVLGGKSKGRMSHPSFPTLLI